MEPAIPDIWSTICEALRGTCDSLVSVLENHDQEALEDDASFLEWLDNEIFRCDDCGWWCEISEESSEEADREGEMVCRECV